MAGSGVPSLLSMQVQPVNMGDNNDYNDHDAQADSDFYVRIRGLPFSASADDVIDFFQGVNIAGQENGITFTFTRDGRPSGEAYICLSSAEDRAAAMAKNRNHLGSRYIEVDTVVGDSTVFGALSSCVCKLLGTSRHVFEANRAEMEYVVKKNGPVPDIDNGDGVLRMRGLPFGCSKEEIVQFFMGYEIVPNGITMTTDAHGRTAGEAYVQFSSQNVAERAVTDKHMKRIGHRYIELFRSTLLEARAAAMGGGIGGGRRPMRPAPYDRSDRYGGPRGGGMYDDYPSPRDRYNGPSVGARYRDFSRGGGMGGGDRFRNGGGRGYGADDDDGGMMGAGAAGGFGRSGMARPGASAGQSHQSSTGHSVHMRGLPFSAGEKDIFMFFSPLLPVDVVLGMNEDGRKSGEADVDFETHDEACEAMKKDKSYMDHRYIELFLNSSSSGYGSGGAARRSRPSFGGPPPQTEARFTRPTSDFDTGDMYRVPNNYGFNSSSQIPPNDSGPYY